MGWEQMPTPLDCIVTPKAATPGSTSFLALPAPLVLEDSKPFRLAELPSQGCRCILTGWRTPRRHGASPDKFQFLWKWLLPEFPTEKIFNQPLPPSLLLGTHRPFCWAPTEAPIVPEVPLLRRLVERTLEGQKGLLETRRICLAKDQRALRYMKFHQHLLTLP